jgi:hypothetical protein
LGDIELLFLLATFFIYHRVVQSICRHWFRMQSFPTKKLDIRDEGLGIALELVLKSTIEAMDHRDTEHINFHEYRCSGPGVR